jgi:Carboxypeptidase regulatory-like domain/TonB dependent receptor
MISRCLSIVICLCAFALSAIAQTDRGTITGTVSDASGAVVPGVTVEAKNVGTGNVYQAGSSETGNFTLPQLPVGTYELSATLPGFKKFVRPNLTVGLAQIVRVDVKLEVGAAGDQVTVEAAAPLLKTESGEVSHNVDLNALSNLPMLTLGTGAGIGNIRNPLATISLLPGASFTNDNTLRVNGMPSSSQAIRIEGQDATNGVWRQLNQGSQPSVDALQEVAIQTSNYDAEYGQAGGGYFNYTMKSGTNSFHGSVFDYLVNEAFNAGTPFSDRISIGDKGRAGQHLRNTQRKNDYGFSLGGPILLGKFYDGRNKTFFFANFEQYRESQFITTGLTTVPTLAYRNGDLSTALLGQLVQGGVPVVDPDGRPVIRNAVYDPRTTRLAPNGSTIRDPFPGNVIDKSLWDPVAAKILAMLPQPTSSGLINNYTIPGYTNFRHTTIPSFKIDHNINDKNRVSFYFADTRTRSPSANGFTQNFTPAAPQASDAWTYRLNYDRTLSPTQLLHVGVGYLYQNIPSVPPEVDPKSFGFQTPFFAPIFPNILGLNDATQGGNNVGLGSGFAYKYTKEYKPTANVAYTWVTGNHSYKFGADLIVDGIGTLNYTRANGVISFGQQQTSIGSWENVQGLTGATGLTGFGFGSFLLGRTTSMNISQLTDSRLGNHSMAFYAQDSWKVTRKLTLNYGLRYDYVTLLKEQYGRMQSANFTKPNPVTNNLPGAVDYEANCRCSFNKNYPWAFGPRLSMAYQFAPKTVLRAGAGIAYSSAPNNAFLSLSVPDFYNIIAPSYGESATILQEGNVFGPGNSRGNAPLVWPDYSRTYPFEVAPGIRPPNSPFIYIDRHAGRPPRIFQWSIGLQRELTQNLLVEAAYVGNRGVWWSAPLLQDQAYNALTLDDVKRAGLDINNAADLQLLNTPISSPAVTNRFPALKDPNSVYPGFPANQPLKQVLRPHPQWGAGIPPFLGPPLGDTWYDSLQVKATQRLARGLSFAAAYTFSKELTNGANSDTSYLTPNPPLISDVYNRALAKQLSSLGHPNSLVISFNYTTPKLPSESGALKLVSKIVHDWTLGGVLRYQSGDLIRVPPSANGLLTQLGRGPENNPALWGGGNTFANRDPTQPLFSKDPNCHCIDPTHDLVLNPKAWVDPGPGKFGTSAPYYNDYRWQRQPSESFSIGRNFRLVGEDKVKLNIRAEFQNVFNRLVLNTPSVGGPGNVNPFNTPITSTNSYKNSDGSVTTGLLSGGYGYVNWVNGGAIPGVPTSGARPRSGQIVARLIF